MQDDRQSEVPPGTFAARLEVLFERFPNPATGRRYTYPAVAAAIAARAAERDEHDRAGRSMSPTYIWQLTVGLRDNPTVKRVEALAEHFGVPPRYFVDDEEEIAVLDGELRMIAAMRLAGVSAVAHRARGLSPGALTSVMSMIDHVRRLEGLPDDGVDGSAAELPSRDVSGQ